MKAYITTKSPFEGEKEVVIRFQHDDYTDEDYAIITLEGFTKIIEFVKEWTNESLKTTFCDDAEALLMDFLKGHSPSKLEEFTDEKLKRKIQAKIADWEERKDE